MEYLPNDQQEITGQLQGWYRLYAPNDNDIIILLGKWVQKHFYTRKYVNINIPHPASVYKKEDKETYVQNAVKQILLIIKN